MEISNRLQTILTPDWLTAVGTLGSVLVALFLALYGDWLRRLILHPKLQLKAKVSRPDADKTQLVQQGIAPITGTPVQRKLTDVYYFRLAIKNIGNIAAENVQVFLESVDRQEDDRYVRAQRFSPMNLRWTHGNGQVTRPLLLPDMPPVYCDMAHICDPKNRTVTGEDLPNVLPGDAVLGLDLEVKPFSNGHLLEPGTYIFTLKLAASNCSPRTYRLEVVFPGTWSDDEERMFSIGFKMRLL